MPSPEWLTERGIGETRWALVEGDDIIEARVLLDAVVPAGSIVEARLADAGRGGRNAVAVADGEEYLLPGGAAGLAQGAGLSIEVTREAIPGGEAWKRPLARPAEAGAGGDRSTARAADLGTYGWDDLLEEARSGIVRFAGGELRVFVTPAMTLVDVDGTLPPQELAVAGAQAVAKAIRRHGIGGSIGIDLPTVAGRAARQAIGEAVEALLPKPFERTAVNGFGFLQVVRPRRHASLFELAADRAAFEARALLRRAGREMGAMRIAAHPAVAAVLERHPDWVDALSRQVGGSVGLRADASLAMSGGHVEKG